MTRPRKSGSGHMKQLASAHGSFDLDVPSSVVTRFRFPMSIAPLDEPGPASTGYLVHLSMAVDVATARHSAVVLLVGDWSPRSWKEEGNT
ncbi:hypothetical protein THAOC_15109 [Thalassiosira oceanica]|uniref:Uncharacterized protein n=1 Tax=Thalassiosira oceanica TaxID=159749 RepID=K0SGV8_THAOC|nr:hypothetical protein THAOC_15109 [Thalassiosira oceanica]|eukprot:EJK64184.1 hypothetical protein THAOC_15109 [Thalassiosira oceanica]